MTRSATWDLDSQRRGPRLAAPRDLREDICSKKTFFLNRCLPLPLQVFQLIFSISSSYLTCCLFQKCQHHFSNLPSQAFQLIFSIFHHILPLVPSFITYSSFFSRLFSLYSSPLVPSFIAYSLSFNSHLFSSKRKLPVEMNLYRRAPAS